MTATEPQPLGDLIAPWMAEAKQRTAAGEDDAWDDHADSPSGTEHHR